MSDILKEIMQRLGYTNYEDLSQSIDDLNKMPEKFIRDASTLHPGEAWFFVRYIVTPENRRFAASYVEAVVFKGEPTEEYGLKRYYMPSVSLNHQLTLSREQMLPFSNGQFNIVELSNFNSWKNGINSYGCPLVEAEGANYLTPTPKGAYSLGETKHRILETPQSIDIAFRRWIAQRAAMMFYEKRELSESDCITILNQYAPQETWTEDAVIAVQALLREKQEFGHKEGEVPGFIGPDEWFV